MKYIVDAKQRAGNCAYDTDDIEAAANILNGIYKAIDYGMYKKGYRNNIAVDYTCACHVLGIDHMQAIGMLGLDHSQELNLRERVRAVEPYLGTWDSGSSLGVFGFMLEEDEWKRWNANYVSPILVELINL